VGEIARGQGRKVGGQPPLGETNNGVSPLLLHSTRKSPDPLATPHANPANWVGRLGPRINCMITVHLEPLHDVSRRCKDIYYYIYQFLTGICYLGTFLAA
jgi:hypothetical protein